MRKARRRLSDMGDDVRHYYELIPQGHPCRLYFDLEFQRALNPGIDDAALMTQFLTVWSRCRSVVPDFS